MTSLASAIMLIPAGFLSDRFGRKWMIIVGSMVTVLTLFYRSVMVEEQSLIYAAFLTGLFMALVQVSGVPFLAENSNASERMHLFSIHFSLVTIASVIGSFGGGVLADALHLYAAMPIQESIKWVLIVGTIVFALGLIPLFKLKPIARQENKTAKTSEKELPSSFKRNIIIIVLFGFSNLLIGTGSGLVIPYLNLYSSNVICYVCFGYRFF